MYDCDIYTRPVWEGDIIYSESILPLDSRDVPLLSAPEEIISVTDARCEKTFYEGKDYIVKNGILHIPEGSDIVIMPWSDYNPQEKSPNPYTAAGFTCRDGGFLMFAEGAEFHNRQYSVTYKRREAWDGYIPSASPEKLPKTKALLREGKAFTFGFLGDSITVGANSSGLVNAPPNAPIWPEMICGKLKLQYGCDIKYVNRAVGGTTSAWGAENTINFFEENIPDVFVIAFGMNDASGGVPNNVFRDNIRLIADKILSLNPGCEIIFVSTTLPNPLANQFVRDHETHEELLSELMNEYGVSSELARVTTIHKYLLKKKRYFDMTGNNINHPNDFLARVYAQTLLALMKP